MLVEGAREIAVQEFIVEYSLGDDVANKPEVAQMVRVEVRRRVGHISDSIARVDHEQGVIRVEYFFGYDHIPLSEQTASVLAFLAFERYVEPVLPVVWRSPI